MYAPTEYPTALIYSVIALFTAGFGVGMIVWQTGASQHALLLRRGLLAGGVLLVLIGALVLMTQILAIAGGSYGGLPHDVP